LGNDGIRSDADWSKIVNFSAATDNGPIIHLQVPRNPNPGSIYPAMAADLRPEEAQQSNPQWAQTARHFWPEWKLHAGPQQPSQHVVPLARALVLA
jgi:hypothetical protein